MGELSASRKSAKRGGVEGGSERGGVEGGSQVDGRAPAPLGGDQPAGAQLTVAGRHLPGTVSLAISAPLATQNLWIEPNKLLT